MTRFLQMYSAEVNVCNVVSQKPLRVNARRELYVIMDAQVTVLTVGDLQAFFMICNYGSLH